MPTNIPVHIDSNAIIDIVEIAYKKVKEERGTTFDTTFLTEWEKYIDYYFEGLKNVCKNTTFYLPQCNFDEEANPTNHTACGRSSILQEIFAVTGLNAKGTLKRFIEKHTHTLPVLYEEDGKIVELKTIIGQMRNEGINSGLPCVLTGKADHRLILYAVKHNTNCIVITSDQGVKENMDWIKGRPVKKITLGTTECYINKHIICFRLDELTEVTFADCYLLEEYYLVCLKHFIDKYLSMGQSEKIDIRQKEILNQKERTTLIVNREKQLERLRQEGIANG